jgi:hypothetical protein
MSLLEQTLIRIVEFLETRKILYMVIGGFANLYWGRPRLTQDIDVTVQVEESDLPDLLRDLQSAYQVLAPSPLDFARATRVLPVRDSNGVRIDLVLATIPYEMEAISRSVAIQVGTQTARICSAEDLILHKLASDRARDWEDVEGVILRQGPKLDREYLDPRVEELGRVLEKPDLVVFYRNWLGRSAAGRPDAGPVQT